MKEFYHKAKAEYLADFKKREAEIADESARVMSGRDWPDDVYFIRLTEMPEGTLIDFTEGELSELVEIALDEQARADGLERHASRSIAFSAVMELGRRGKDKSL